jgi:hypothetical protein
MKEDATRRLLLLIEEQLGWGDSADWPSKDFERLNILIQEKTKVSLSASTLRRVWGKVDYNNQPSITTLDTLAQFAGYESWRFFGFAGHEITNIKPVSEPIPGKRSKLRALYLSGLLIVMAIIVAVAVVFVKPVQKAVNKKDYVFSYRPVTHDLPNSVIFTYDAHMAPNDSVFIQQSWDNARRTRVAKTGHTYSSIYYNPGFYHAKLVIGNQVVKESPLLIPTNGWLGMIEQRPLPVYLDRHEFLSKTGLSINASTVLNHHVLLEPEPPVIEFYNTGNFKPVPVSNFSYKAEVKCDYNRGASRCRQLYVVLFTDHIPISIPLSEPGCVASLSLLNGVGEVDGSAADFSGFGADLSDWVSVSCLGKNGRVVILINGKQVYSFPITDQKINILGLGFSFHGSGAVRGIELSSGNNVLFIDLN